MTSFSPFLDYFYYKSSIWSEHGENPEHGDQKTKHLAPLPLSPHPGPHRHRHPQHCGGWPSKIRNPKHMCREKANRF